MREALSTQEVRTKLAAQGLDAAGTCGAEFGGFLREQLTEYTRVVADAKIRGKMTKRGRKYCPVSPAALMIGGQRLACAAHDFPEPSGVLIIGWKRSLLDVRAHLVRAQRRVDLGVEPADDARRRAERRHDRLPDVGKKPTSEKPCSLNVGTSGNSGSRDELVTASARTLPSWIIGSAFDTGAKFDVDAAAEEIDAHLLAAFVRHVDEREPGGKLERICRRSAARCRADSRT